MKLDVRCTPTTILLAAMLIFPPFAAMWHFPLHHGKTVSLIENGQAIFLGFGALMTLIWIKSQKLQGQSLAFWRWALIWWLTLLGRSTSWGRDYFHHEPHWLFRLISVILIGALVLSLLSPTLRQAIAQRWSSYALPLWPLIIIALGFLMSDAVEHHRLVGRLIIHDRSYQDLAEELFENPLILGLILICANFMRQEAAPEYVHAVDIG